MHDHVDAAQVAGEVVALVVNEVEVAADVLSHPTRDFHAPDIVTDRVMCTGFTDEDPWARLEAVDRGSAADQFHEVALLSREENGERSQFHFARCVGRDAEKCLRVGHDQRGRLIQRCRVVRNSRSLTTRQ